MIRCILISLLAISASAFVLDKNPCTKIGFYSLRDNTPTFYGCYRNRAGGFTLKHLICPNEQVFSAAVGHCVFPTKGKNFVALAENEESTTQAVIAPITTPPPVTDNLETTNGPTETTKDPETTKQPETTDGPTETTENPETTKQPETTDGPTETTGNPETTKQPETTDGPTVTTENPETTKHPQTTGGPTETSANPETTDGPTVTTENPTETTENPTETTENPTKTTENPTETTENPTETTENPTDTTGNPTETTGTTGAPKPFDCPTSGFFPTNGACNQYVFCYNSKGRNTPVNLECPGEQKFNPCTLICDANYDCGECEEVQQFAQFDCESEGTFPDRHDSSKFFECKWSQAANKFQSKQRSCVEGEVFHILTGRCGRRSTLPLHLFRFGN